MSATKIDWSQNQRVPAPHAPDDIVLTVREAVTGEVTGGPGRAGRELVGVPDNEVQTVDSADAIGIPRQCLVVEQVDLRGIIVQDAEQSRSDMMAIRARSAKR